MQTVTTMGLDIAKPVFQVHGVDDANQVVIRRQLKRRQVVAFFQKLPACLLGTEACASSHHWARELQALGHTMRSMPPAYVKPASDGRRTTWPTQRFARRSPDCGSYRPDA
jgi:transposase